MSLVQHSQRVVHHSAVPQAGQLPAEQPLAVLPGDAEGIRPAADRRRGTRENHSGGLLWLLSLWGCTRIHVLMYDVM